MYELNDSGSIHLTPSVINDKYIIRFCVDSPYATEDDMSIAWELIKTHSKEILNSYTEKCLIISNSKTEKLVEFDSLVDMTKSRRKSFTRMVSDPIGMKSDVYDSFENNLSPHKRLKKRLSRFKAVQYYSNEIISEDVEQTDLN